MSPSRREFVRQAAAVAAGEGDVLTTNAVTGDTKRRYGYRGTSREDRGAVMELALDAGEGVDAIRDIPSAGELVHRLWNEWLDAA